jgi:hypothetical protein
LFEFLSESSLEKRQTFGRVKIHDIPHTLVLPLLAEMT